MCFLRFVVATAFFVTTTSLACATQLITNGGFELGDLSGWTVTDLEDNGDSWFAASGTATPSGILTPRSNLLTVGAASGDYYAVTDQRNPGAHALTQSFTIAPGSSVMLSFDMFINNYAGELFHLGALDPNVGDNQFGTVDILRADASAFDTDINVGLLQNLFIGLDTAGVNDYVHYDKDITDIVGAGGTFQLRFAEVDNQLFFNMGIDNVSITDAPVPEPGTMILLGTGFLGLAAFTRFRRKA